MIIHLKGTVFYHVDYKLLLVGLSVLIVLHMVDYRLSLVWGFPFFIVFDRAAYGRLQTLASVGLSVFLLFSFALHDPLQTSR